MKEIWKDVVGYEGYYQVSNLGNVFRIKSATSKGGILKQQKNELGYCFVTLCVKGKRKCCRVHRLVAMAFIPNPQNKEQINHLDYNPSNNCVNNLEWATPKENTVYSIEHMKEAQKGHIQPESAKRKIMKLHYKKNPLCNINKTESGKYGVRFSGFKHWKLCDSLEDAIKYRNNFIKTNMSWLLEN